MNNKTLTIIARSDNEVKKSLGALKNALNFIPYKKAILFTSRGNYEKHASSNVSIIKVDPIFSSEDYSKFIIYELYKYIETTHVLIIQWDGKILNPGKWKEDFLNIDYIGAPLVPRDSDYRYSRDKYGSFYCVGCGGFSIRSKKLLEAPTKYKLKDDVRFTNTHEDGFFCVLHRKFLESKGFIWADYQLAKEFCIESPLTLEDIFSFPLGFHGRKMLLISKFLAVPIFLINWKIYINLLINKLQDKLN